MTVLSRKTPYTELLSDQFIAWKKWMMSISVRRMIDTFKVKNLFNTSIFFKTCNIVKNKNLHENPLRVCDGLKAQHRSPLSHTFILGILHIKPDEHVCEMCSGVGKVIGWVNVILKCSDYRDIIKTLEIKAPHWHLLDNSVISPWHDMRKCEMVFRWM